MIQVNNFSIHTSTWVQAEGPKSQTTEILKICTLCVIKMRMDQIILQNSDNTADWSWVR